MMNNGIEFLTYRDAGPVSSETRYILIMIVGKGSLDETWTRMDVFSINPQDIVDYGEELVKSFSSVGIMIKHDLLYDHS